MLAKVAKSMTTNDGVNGLLAFCHKNSYKEFRMQIEWKSETVSPYLFKQAGEWPGIRVHRAHVLPGRMLEHTNTFHEVNVAIAGSLTTEKISANGKHIATKGCSGNLCITPAGQAISAV